MSNVLIYMYLVSLRHSLLTLYVRFIISQQAVPVSCVYIRAHNEVLFNDIVYVSSCTTQGILGCVLCLLTCLCTTSG